MKIRQATLDDLDVIQQLHDLYVLDVNRVDEPDYASEAEKEGFTVSSGERNLRQRIEKSEIFNVAEENGVVAGYVDINYEIYFPKDADNIIWFDQKIKQEYFRGDKTTVLHHIAVVEEFKGKGVAKLLLDDAIERLKAKGVKHLFAIVTTAPLTNCASIIWHTKMGFQRVCVTKPIDLFGLKNYESVVFYKSI